MTPALYRIRDWQSRYENSESRKLTRLSWLPLPIKLNGTGYGLLMGMPDGPAIFGCFVALAEVAGETPKASGDSPDGPGKSPGRDGALRRSDGRPHTAATLSIRTRMPQALIQQTLEALSSGELDWIEKVAPGDSPDIPGELPDAPGDSPDHIEGNNKARQGSEGKGTAAKGREQAGKAGADDSRETVAAGLPGSNPPPDPIQEITNALHEATGKPPDLALAERLCRETAVEGIHPMLVCRWVRDKALERKNRGDPIRLPKLFLDDWPSEMRAWLRAHLAVLSGGRHALMESPVCGRCKVQQFVFEDGCIVRCKCKPRSLAVVSGKVTA